MYERRVWHIKVFKDGFKFPLFLETTEDHIREYMESELPNCSYRYSGATDEEIDNAKKLRLAIYMYK